jgi:CheY-like chemotaxis protein
MSFRALLVSEDNQAVEALTPVLSNFGLNVHRCSYSQALSFVTDQKFHAVVVDFDDPHNAALIFENLSDARFHSRALTVALLTDKTKVRNAFGIGANFVLYKPIDEEQAEGTLRATASLIRNERRGSFRVPVQVPVTLTSNSGEESIDGILLDLSEEGMDVLASRPLYCSAVLSARFMLPDLLSDLELPGEVVWANPNGESGICFADVPENARATLRTWLADHARQTPPQEPALRPDCKLTDLSIGGCYVETASPFPERTRLLMKLRVGGTELGTSGVVRVMHPSIGMGIEFTRQTADQYRETEDFILSLSSQSGDEPELLLSPRGISSEDSQAAPASELDDPLLELLRNHESLSQEMFLETLQRQRSGEILEAQ